MTSLERAKKAWQREEKIYLKWLRKMISERNRRTRHLWYGPARRRYEAEVKKEAKP